jgi:hypothetical protein
MRTVVQIHQALLDEANRPIILHLARQPVV